MCPTLEEWCKMAWRHTCILITIRVSQFGLIFQREDGELCLIPRPGQRSSGQSTWLEALMNGFIRPSGFGLMDPPQMKLLLFPVGWLYRELLSGFILSVL